ncbi:MAG: type I DNA topoisomerase [Chloroflexi bacterium]|nr:type I DNA topoisomerase [Chloroflexota bacterium]
MSTNLVIVESPAKAKTIGKILGSGYTVKASKGHVRDLPQYKLGVDVTNSFAPRYEVPKEKKEVVAEIKEMALKARKIYLATDPDREGEAISWHLTEAAKMEPSLVHRVTLHEITREAVTEAFKHTHHINMDLVNAQQARRILDRLVGYKISPLLWRKIRSGLSAGRVQSAAVKMVVDREREIQAFQSVEYWTIEAELARQTAAQPTFRAQLIKEAGSQKIEIHNQTEAESLRAILEKAGYSVASVVQKDSPRSPAPPFITSTLQQEAYRKLGFPAKQTMALAQQLYEGLPAGDEGTVGLITYMRTDSTHVAPQAIAETRDFIQEKYGPSYLPEHARHFLKKVKGAQEAHEAIRPTRTHREPALIKPFLTSNQFRLYELIWKRMVASQMAAAVFQVTTVEVKAESQTPRKTYLFRAVSTVSRFPGFMTLYIESRDESSDENGKGSLPPLVKGEPLNLLGLFPEQHFTQPPPRYTEATLIKAMEEAGIGRPSTYAPTLSTIQDRGYVKKEQGKLMPEELGLVVNDLLAEHFHNIIDLGFTAKMEEELDEIASGKREWVPVISEFYGPFEETLEKAHQNAPRVEMKPETTGEACPQCGKPLVVKTGRFGKFVACSGYPECKYTKKHVKTTGVKCPECGKDILERMSKKKKVFYGCSGYPECKFVSNRRPVPTPCPSCGGLITLQGKNRVKCMKCGYTGPYQVESEEKEPVGAGKGEGK